MSSELRDNVTNRRKTGRPKGVLSSQSQRMLETWDTLQREHPKLNKVALLNLVADSLFGERTNVHVRRNERNKLKRTLQRHGRY
ncbi:MAG TPA: hypothetical protein VJ372_12685 [Pyrinomonadaceae bacterium]|jgi:hypothetical protein|nr:hypothetical protein [Pyrinomonadaceae bacterium]